MKCWNSAFNAQGSRLTIVVVQVWALKIYVAAEEGKEGMKLSLHIAVIAWMSSRKERTGQSHFSSKFAAC
jgi:hypothetical protein